jgi:hypothetical protein
MRPLLTVRMNLNTKLRHDVFNVEQLSSTVPGEIPDKRLRQSFYKTGPGCRSRRVASSVGWQFMVLDKKHLIRQNWNEPD